MIYPLVAVVALLIKASIEIYTGCTVCDVDDFCSTSGFCCEIKNITTEDNVPRYRIYLTHISLMFFLWYIGQTVQTQTGTKINNMGTYGYPEQFCYANQ